MTNDGWADWKASRIVMAAWLAVFGLLVVLVSGEDGLGRPIVMALAITGTAALAAHAVVILYDHLTSPWRWPAMAAALLAVTTLGHALLAKLGMRQSWAQDLLNLTIISGVALTVRLAWAGYRTRWALEAEIARRHDAETRLEVAQHAGARPSGPVPVKVGHGQALLDPTTVSLLEANGNFARIQTQGGVIFASESLKALAERFAPYGFVRVHKSFVVSLLLVRARKGDRLEMSDGCQVPIGRAFRASLD